MSLFGFGEYRVLPACLPLLGYIAAVFRFYIHRDLQNTSDRDFVSGT